MKRFLLSAVVAVSSLTANASAMADVSDLRSENQKIYESLVKIEGSCAVAYPLLTSLYAKLSGLKSATIASTDQTNHYAQEAIKFMDLALTESKSAGTGCSSDQTITYARILIEMYLLHADTELMLYQYGLDEKGYKKN